jgi:putative ABC transport system permease protein
VVSTFQTALVDTEYTALTTSLDTLQKLYETDAVTYMAVYLARYEDAHAVAALATERLAGTGIAVYTYDHPTLGQYYVSTLRFIYSVIGFIGLIVVSVIAFAMFNATTLSVLERTREMGTLRALGYKRSHVRGLYAREAALLAVLACAGGLALSTAGSMLVNWMNVRFHPPGAAGALQLMFTPTPALCLVLAVIMVAASVLTALLAVRARLRESVVGLLTAARA